MTNLLSETPDLPQSFGYKMSWFAVKTDDPQEVARVLGLRDLKPAPWMAGIAAAYHNAVFLTPSLKGWVLAVGFVEDEQVLAMLGTLEACFGEAQFFWTHRVVELHAWAWFRDGALLRAYGYLDESGEVFWNSGPPLPSEPELGADDFPNEQDVMTVAGRWSIDPTEIDRMGLPPSLGLLGRAAA